jgi:hypothetical protein
MGVYPMELTIDYDSSMGDITFEISNTLDSFGNEADESIGVGDIVVLFDGVPSD